MVRDRHTAYLVTTFTGSARFKFIHILSRESLFAYFVSFDRSAGSPWSGDGLCGDVYKYRTVG